MTGETLERARGAALEIAARFAMSSATVELLSDSNNTVFVLHPYAVVAKVATGDHQRAALELDVATFATAHRGPVVPTTACPPPKVHEHDRLQVTFWRFAEAEASETVPSAIADALYELHRILENYPQPLPPLDAELSAVGQVLADRRQARSLPPDDRALLRCGLQKLRSALRALSWPARPLHGSPSSGNQINSSGAVRFIDFETACVGPVEWDLAHLSDEVVRCYPSHHDEQLLRICRGLVSIKTATWCWANYRHPDLQWHAEHHLRAARLLLRTS